MFKKRELDKIKKQVMEFFEKMCFSIEVDLKYENETLLINLKSEEPRILIGEKGKMLSHIQYILRLILNKGLEKRFYIDLDINDYKKKKAQYLKETAWERANKVVLNKQEEILFPMSAYERRVIHLELKDREDVVTESIGQEPDRRVVIKPKQ
ncbi:MAG: KH domain-containing protein [Candidatus Pacebacteria bacterium]|nr:KH domain-containing protein [Candidatus Paceibacterota bacterium]